ncbi:MAG: hypothetical protein IPP93_10420 [Chitinophagaceae bacterium]|nr:hypothetical protein [Chitinophagaceae bacterium]
MKLLFSFLAFLITSSSFGQWNFSSPGRVKVTLVRFFCTKETSDDIFDGDGKKDEVFFSFMYTVAGINGNTKLSSKTITGVFGDATGSFSSRTSAGSATDILGNNRGGIKTDDVVSCNVPILDVTIGVGDVVSLVPSIWEWDNNNFNVQTSFEESIMSAFPQMNTKIVEHVRYCFPTVDDQSCFRRNGTGYLGLPECSGILQSVSNRPGNRPIGMSTNGGYVPIVISMGAELLEKVAGMQFSNIGMRGHTDVGNIPVVFNEEGLGNTRDHGNYGMYLKVEFIKSTPPPPPTQSPKMTKQPVGTKTLNQTNLNAATSITGKWTGTYGSGESATPSFYSFQLNADGSIQLLNESGNVIASGTYSFTNNVLTANYKYTSGSEFSLSGTLQNNTLSGTWGSYKSVSGGGRWVTNKN